MFEKGKPSGRYPNGMKRLVAISLALLALSACRPAEKKAASEDQAGYRKEIADWQGNRATRLEAEDSWLTLIGLHWLREGENTVTLRKAGAPLVKIDLAAGKATLHPVPPMTAEGKPLTGPTVLLSDADEKGPTVVQMDTVRFNVIKRGERYALRVKDAAAETRTHFAGLEYFPIDPKWRVEARLERYNPPKKVAIDDITGMRSETDIPGALVFTVDGKEYRIDPLPEGDELFIIFKDTTSRDATYPAGRYLYAKMPGADGKVIVDFNKAYNPPCAFTPFATCPLPPPQNRLPIRIEAGEKKYSGGHA